MLEAYTPLRIDKSVTKVLFLHVMGRICFLKGAAAGCLGYLVLLDCTLV